MQHTADSSGCRALNCDLFFDALFFVALFFGAMIFDAMIFDAIGDGIVLPVKSGDETQFQKLCEFKKRGK